MSDLPLSGVRITDLTHYWSGPHAMRILGDLGADVIKIEFARRMCVLRGAFTKDKVYDRHPRWHQANRNKRSMTLDLKDPRQRGILDDLVRISDVVAENSRGGVMKALGAGYEDFKRIKPDIIMLSMPAYGSTGPWSTYAGVGGALEPTCGLQALTAYDKNDKRRRIKEADVTSGIMGACAVLTALYHRKRTGGGQWIDMSQLEILSHSLFGEHLLEFMMNGTQTLPLGNRHANYAPQGCYRCKGEDNWIVLTIRSDAEWQALCDVLRRPEMKNDTRFRTRESRRKNHDEIDKLIEAWTSGRDKREVMHVLQERGIAAGAVADLAEVADDAHLRARGYFQEARDGTPGLYPGVPISASGWDIRVRRRGPDLGGDNARVVTELLGRPVEDAPVLNENDVGTAFDNE